jgi:DNA-binding response OmpR family regulator
MNEISNHRPDQHILLVEDDLSLQPLFDAIIHDIDPKIEIDWATSAETACQILEDTSQARGKIPYDLIIVDIFLEGKITGVDLWTLCQTVFPKMPALLMSQLPVSKYYDFVGKEEICAPFLQKPLNLSESRRTILGYLKGE